MLFDGSLWFRVPMTIKTNNNKKEPAFLDNIKQWTGLKYIYLPFLVEYQLNKLIKSIELSCILYRKTSGF